MTNKYKATDPKTGSTSDAKQFASPKGAAIAFENDNKVFFKFYKNPQAALDHIEKCAPHNEPGSLRIAKLEIL